MGGRRCWLAGGIAGYCPCLLASCPLLLANSFAPWLVARVLTNPSADLALPPSTI